MTTSPSIVRRSVSLILILGLWCVVTAPVAAQAAAAAASPAGEGAWDIGPRPVPVPASASEALRASIAATPQPDVATRRRMMPPNEEAWLAQQKASSAAPLDALAEQFGVTIEPGELAGVRIYRVTPEKPVARHADHVFLHVHGGGYVFNGGDGSATEAAFVAGRIGIRTISVDYRMPPRDPFPAAVDDVVAVYRHLLKEHDGTAIAIGGTSAGGGLTLATVHKLRSLGLDLPGAIYAGTPWADLTKTGDTLYTNEGLDRILVTYDGWLGAAARLYANGHDLKDPLLSPVYGDFTGFPPTYFVTGTRDMFLSDTARTHRKMRAAGVIADLNVWEGVSHADYLVVGDSPESREMFADLGRFLDEHLP